MNPSPITITDSDRRLLAIESQAAEVGRLAIIESGCKEALKAAKADKEDAIEELLTLCCAQQEAAEADANDATRPLLSISEGTTPDAADATPDAKSGDWRRWGIGRLALPASVQEYLEQAGYLTMGWLKVHMDAKKTFWAKDMRAGDLRKPPRFQEIVESGWNDFYKEHGEITQ